MKMETGLFLHQGKETTILCSVIIYRFHLPAAVLPPPHLPLSRKQQWCQLSKGSQDTQQASPEPCREQRDGARTELSQHPAAINLSHCTTPFHLLHLILCTDFVME